MKVYLILLFLFIDLLCCAQEQSTNNVPVSILTELSPPDVLTTKNKASFKDITDLLPRGYVVDGTVDYTMIIQKALNENRKVLMPNFPVLISDKSLIIPSNTVIYFQPKSIILMMPSSKGEDSKNHYYALKLNKVTNVSIFNCKIRGDRFQHIGKIGEWGMGIGILGSSNVVISGGRIEDCWGDGIYIGKVNQQSSIYKGFHLPSSAVVIENMLINNNRRNGISVTSGVDIEVKNIVVSNSNSVLPMAGIDIEPNTNLDLIKNIKLNKVTTYNNGRDGILLALTKMSSSKSSQEVSIFVDNHKDIGSYSPLRIGSGFRKGDRKMIGDIRIQNCVWEGNKVGVRYNNGRNLLPNVRFQNNSFRHLKGIKKKSDDKYLNTSNLEVIFR